MPFGADAEAVEDEMVHAGTFPAETELPRRFGVFADCEPFTIGTLVVGDVVLAAGDFHDELEAESLAAVREGAVSGNHLVEQDELVFITPVSREAKHRPLLGVDAAVDVQTTATLDDFHRMLLCADGFRK